MRFQFRHSRTKPIPRPGPSPDESRMTKHAASLWLCPADSRPWGVDWRPVSEAAAQASSLTSQSSIRKSRSSTPKVHASSIITSDPKARSSSELNDRRILIVPAASSPRSPEAAVRTLLPTRMPSASLRHSALSHGRKTTVTRMR
jgi:hypothetical protein